MRKAALLSLMLAIGPVAVPGRAQAPAAATGKTRASGVITAVDPGGKLTIKTDQGADLNVTFSDSTRMSKAVLEGKTPKVVGKGATSDLAVGSRVLLSGAMAEDQKTLAATNLVVLPKE